MHSRGSSVKKVFAAVTAALMMVALVSGAAAAATTTGTWSQYPTGAPVYSAQIQQPINPDGSSNWPAKSKGGIPIMFSLSSGTGAAVFESIGSDPNAANDYAYASFAPTGLTFGGISTLRTDYAFTLGDCHGGALRWSVRTSSTQSLFIYYGGAPSFTDCTTGVNNQSGVNMIGSSDLRYDTSQYVGGTFYDTYTHALSLMGGLTLSGVTLVLDGGWAGDQRATISNTTVNDNVYQWNAGGTGTFTSTCNLPAATLKVTKTAGATSGAIDETTVYPTSDSGTAFRIVDCKYQYVLSIPSLQGAGTYHIEIQIGGVTVGTANFDLK
jgi:hypothetical protein